METSLQVNLIPWKKITSMETSMQVGGSRFASMEISMEVEGSRFTAMEVSASVHGNTWKFALSVEVP